MAWLLCVYASPALSAPTTTSSQGYYKDLFIDCGRYLLCAKPHAANALKLSHESMRVSSDKAQASVLVSSEHDENGVLLFPDGAPRYRAVYVNGGESKDHGRSLGTDGLARFRRFFEQGGSYTGSCAGAFIASKRRMGKDMQSTYFAIWPGETKETWFDERKSSWYIGPSGFKIEKDSPLLEYNDFGNDHYVDAIKHYEGPFALEEQHWPEGTQVLARFDLPKARFHNTPSIWAYKPKKASGRLVVVASHPENYSSGERRDLMASIFEYALAGTGAPRLKGHLVSNRSIEMNRSTGDNDPCRTKIGDGQIHHFVWKVPKGASSLELSLQGDAKLSSGEAANVDLFASPQKPAWPDTATHSAASPGHEETLRIEDPQAGLWYIAVRGTTLATPATPGDATRYKSNLGALNGVAYTLSARLNDASDPYLEPMQDPDPWCDKFLDEAGDLPEDEGSNDEGSDDQKSPDSKSDSGPDDPDKTPEQDSKDSTDPTNESPDSTPSPKQSPNASQDPKPEPATDDKGCRFHHPSPSSPWRNLALSLVIASLYVKSRRRNSSVATSKHKAP